MNEIITLSEFIIDRQGDFPYASGDLSRLLSDIGIAAKIVNQQVNKAGLGDILGALSSSNVQGETQQKLDVFADRVFINAFQTGGQVCGIASEENDRYVAFDRELCMKGKYVVLFDPLDGSSNIDVNVSIGTIFSIFRRVSSIGDRANVNDFLQPGLEQVAAGYVIYGSSTMLVYSTGHGVNGFTLEPSIGEFCLSHPNMRIPEDGVIYSINEGNLAQVEAGVRAYVEYCKGLDKASNRPYSARYIGSLVADFHRNLIHPPKTPPTANCACFTKTTRWPSLLNRRAAWPPMANAAFLRLHPPSCTSAHPCSSVQRTWWKRPWVFWIDFGWTSGWDSSI